jgi:hypothetical protein
VLFAGAVVGAYLVLSFLDRAAHADTGLPVPPVERAVHTVSGSIGKPVPAVGKTVPVARKPRRWLRGLRTGSTAPCPR